MILYYQKRHEQRPPGGIPTRPKTCSNCCGNVTPKKKRGSKDQGRSERRCPYRRQTTLSTLPCAAMFAANQPAGGATPRPLGSDTARVVCSIEGLSCSLTTSFHPLAHQLGRKKEVRNLERLRLREKAERVLGNGGRHRGPPLPPVRDELVQSSRLEHIPCGIARPENEARNKRTHSIWIRIVPTTGRLLATGSQATVRRATLGRAGQLPATDAEPPQRTSSTARETTLNAFSYAVYLHVTETELCTSSETLPPSPVTDTPHLSRGTTSTAAPS